MFPSKAYNFNRHFRVEETKILTVRKVRRWYEKSMVRIVHCTKSPQMVRNVYGTKSLWYEKSGILPHHTIVIIIIIITTLCFKKGTPELISSLLTFVVHFIHIWFVLFSPGSVEAG